MRFLRLYGRVFGLLGRDRRLAGLLALANLVVSVLLFLDPILFGRVIACSRGRTRCPRDTLWQQAVYLLGIWAAVGAVGILANMAVALYSERMAHRNRLYAMSRFYSHVLNMPLSFHGDTHSGRLIKVMMAGADAMFAFWLSFFRDQFATVVSVVVLLPLTMLLNWKLALTLIVLVLVFTILTALVMHHTEEGQRQVETYNSSLAGTAQDALANVMVVQSFTRLEGGNPAVQRHRQPGDRDAVPGAQLVGGGERLDARLQYHRDHIARRHRNDPPPRGEAGVGEIVSFMGFATLLIGRMEWGVLRLLPVLPGALD